MPETTLDDLMTMEQLARAVRMNRERLRKMCVAAGIAVQWGGSKAHPHLRAKLADVERIILSNRYVRPDTLRRQCPRPPSSKIHRLVKC